MSKVTDDQQDTTGLHDFDQEIFSGRMFSVLRPDPEAIEIEDIAHALSLLCRFNGHCLRFYSVAQHSVNVATCLEETGEPRCVIFAGLLHDAAEAYVADLIRPIKVLPDMAAYRQVEYRMQSAITKRFCLVDDQHTRDAIHLADNRVLRAEARDLMRSRGKEWGWNGILAWEGSITYGLEPHKAEKLFLSRFRQLKD